MTFKSLLIVYGLTAGITAARAADDPEKPFSDDINHAEETEVPPAPANRGKGRGTKLPPNIPS